MTAVRFGYLISRYPATNHTFILREVIGLRRAGIVVSVVAIRGPDVDVLRMSSADREEHETSFRVLPARAATAVAMLRQVFTSPLRVLRATALALRLAGPRPRELLSHVAYLAEALVVADRFKLLGVRHVHSHFSSTVAVIAAAVGDFTVSLTIHGPAEFEDAVGFGMAEKVARSRMVIAISDFGRSQIMRSCDPEHWPKIRVARLGVDPAVFRPTARARLNRAFSIVSVGRLAPIKAQRVLLAAFLQLRRKGHRVTLTLVGIGPDEPALREFVRQHDLQTCVTFAGAMNEEQVADLLQTADGFALASFAEGIPVVLMEAMAAGVPCVATWVNGVPELIQHERSGLLVAPGDPSALADALQRLIEDPGLASRLSEGGRAVVCERYVLERNVALLASVFRENLAGEGEPAQGTEFAVTAPSSLDRGR